MAIQLTHGAIKDMTSGRVITPSWQPVIQIAGLKKISKENIALRYRILLNDGEFTMSSAMLASALNELADSDAISSFCVVKVLDYTCQGRAETDRRILMLNNLKIIRSGNEVGGKIGNPMPLKQAETSNDQPALAQRAVPAALKEAVTNAMPKQSFYGQNTPQSAASKQIGQSKATAPGTPGDGPLKVYPIASITPYQNRWTIKARVTQKSAIRTYSNSRGEGKFFNCVFSDDSGEIKATAWKTECDKFFDFLDLNKVYFISKAQLKTADKRFSSTNNDYEMNLAAETKIQACDDVEAATVPSIQYSFVGINDLNNKPVSSNVDVVGVVNNIGDLQTIVSKASQKEVTKRDLELVDDSLMAVRLTIWGDEAKNFPSSGNMVLAIKGAKISDWNGRSLSALSSSQVMLSPDCPDAHRLRGWYDSKGAGATFRSYQSDGGSNSSSQSTAWKTLDAVRKENIGMGDKPEYYTVKAMMYFIKKDNCMYKACPSEGCNKKVIDNNDGTYRCEKCNRSGPEFKWRLLLQCNLGDTTGFLWATAFQEVAEKLLSKSANEMGDIREADEDRFNNVIKESLYKPYQMKLRSKMESYNDDNRLKTVCIEVKELDFVAYNKKLLQDIRTLISQ